MELSRDGPGLLLRDILSGEADVLAAARIVAAARPDVLVLTDFDHDAGSAALSAFAARIAAEGHALPHAFAPAPNTGLDPGIDRDGDGRAGRARDGQGYGVFRGQGGMAILSAFPVDASASREFSDLLWRDLPGALLSEGPPPAGAAPDQRMSSVGHWDVSIATPDGPLRLFAFHATPPVFDGPEDRNGRRNHDEVVFWRRYLDGDLPVPPPDAPFVLAGNANLDPDDGEGLRDAILGLLTDPRVADPRPASPGGRASADPGHSGDPALDTADWPDPPRGPGNLRVDYVLPSADLEITGAGVWWPAGDADVTTASRHRMVWVDIVLP